MTDQYEELRASDLLRQYWGYESFRPGQEEIIRDVVSGRDVLAVLPTGAGKSLCYQLPAVMSKAITIVISPLVALMADQVQALRSRGIKAVFLNSTQTYRDREHAWAELEHGACRLVFVSPEMLGGEVFEARAPRLNITRVAVDEAHCISEWGHEFRPAYLQIASAVEKIGRLPILAVTATAPPRVQREISSCLGLTSPAQHIHDVDRPNIIWSVFRDSNLRRRVNRVLEGVPGPGILYAGTRANADAWARYLVGRGVSAVAYHAGMSTADRTRAQKEWFEGSRRVAVATSAFGMGIDKPDVRFVLHTMLPGSLDAYYQEAGRAGRDGKKSFAVLIAPEADSDRLREWNGERYPAAREMRRVYDVVCDFGGVAVGSDSGEPFPLEVARMAEVCRLSYRRARAAVDHLELLGIWQTHVPPAGRAWMRLGSGEPLKILSESANKPELRALAEALVRADRRPGPLGLSEIDLKLLAKESRLPEYRVEEGLKYLQSIGVVDDVAGGSRLIVSLQDARSRKPALGRERLSRLRRRAKSRVEDLIAYASVRDCRRRVLRNYFGEKAPPRCGACDNCLGRHKRAD